VLARRSAAATLIAFFFFALSFREQPFKAEATNRLKLFSEFQIFGVPPFYARGFVLIQLILWLANTICKFKKLN
jgi:hypothetical protein